jgi:hypothetical protein
VQDLTPQLRTRLSRVERAVGVFVLLATLLLLTGFSWYVYQTGVRKGWFVTKARYFTLLDSAEGLKVGDPVKLMGFDVGEITYITSQKPDDFYNVYVEFNVREPYFGYLWTGGSKARVNPTDFLGKRALEVTKGTNYMPSHLQWEFREYPLSEVAAFATNRDKILLDHVRDPESLTNANIPMWLTLQPLDTNVLAKLTQQGLERVRVADKSRTLEEFTAIWDLQGNAYVPFTPQTGPFYLAANEAPALTERLEGIVRETEIALTNQLVAILDQLSASASNANAMLVATHPLLAHATAISSNLVDPAGSLGRWALPPELHAQFLVATTNANLTLVSANAALTNTTVVLTNTSALLTSANTNVAAMVAQLDVPLRELATIVSNLNLQVSANTNFVTTLNNLLLHSDELIQGFKRHWFLRGAFKEKPPPKPKPTNAPPRRLSSPRGRLMWE